MESKRIKMIKCKNQDLDGCNTKLSETDCGFYCSNPDCKYFDEDINAFE